jgi:hypothetical protein
MSRIEEPLSDSQVKDALLCLIWWEIKVKLKISLSPCLTKHHAMKAYLGVEV